MNVLNVKQNMDMQQPLLDILFAHTESTDGPLGDSREEVEEKLNAWHRGIWRQNKRERDWPKITIFQH